MIWTIFSSCLFTVQKYLRLLLEPLTIPPATCGDDERLLEPVDVGGGVGPHAAPDLPIRLISFTKVAAVLVSI